MLGKGENLMSRVITLLDSHVQFSTEKVTVHTKKCESITHSWGEKKKPTEIETVKKNQTGILN